MEGESGCEKPVRRSDDIISDWICHLGMDNLSEPVRVGLDKEGVEEITINRAHIKELS